MGTLDCKAYDAEIRCLAVFSSQVTILAYHVIATTITMLVAANKGVHFLPSFIPSELMTTPPNPLEAELPGPPTRSHEYQTDVWVKCKQEWLYLMHLLQYWYDTTTVYTYSGPVRQESKLMLFVYYQVNAMLNSNSIFIQLHEVMNFTLWGRYYKDSFRPAEWMEYLESHRHIIARLELLQNWLKNRYLVEATEEWKFITIHSGSLDRIPFPCSYKDQRPGNEGPFYHSKGVRLQIEPTPEDTPCIANSMLESLAHHDWQQSEARDCQEYQWQQDNTSSPMADFPSPTSVGREATSAPDCLEGTTVAAVPVKKKIKVQEYHPLQAEKEQHVATYIDEDENGEELDYYDFEPQDDLDSIQIGYRTPTPTPKGTSEPMATPESMTPKTVSGMPMHHATAAANRAPGFGRGVPLTHALPMQIGTPVTSLQRTPLHSTTAEEALLRGATLLCSLWQEAMLLGPPPPLLTDNHLKMMDALCHLDTVGLQFICESVEALRRERMPAQPPPDYHTLQVTDSPQVATNSLMSQQFLRATSNLGTAIVTPLQLLPEQHPAGDCCPDPEIENMVTNMHRHEQASRTPLTDRNNNPQ